MDIYKDYEAWKQENYKLIHTLVKNKSKTIARFSCVLVVVDYLSELVGKGKSLSNDEELIFSTGYDYVYDKFQMIESLLNEKFNNDFNKMETCAKGINLLLYIHDFQDEIKEYEKIKSEVVLLDDLEEKVYKHLDNNEDVPDEYFLLLDEITNKIFELNDIEINTIDEIFYEIALEYDIYNDNDYDIYNHIINQQIKKTRK